MYICSPHLYTVATLPWKIQKSHFHLHYRRRKQTVTALPTTPEKCHRTTLKNAQVFHLSHFFHAYRVPIRDTDKLRKPLVATWAEFQQSAWWMMQLISGEKDWKHVSVQKVVTFNICCNIACLTFHLPHITTGSFQSHQCQPTTCFFRATNVWRNTTLQHTFSQMKKFAFYEVVR